MIESKRSNKKHNTEKCNATWVEKYRPADFTKIVLTDYNKHFFSKMIEKNIIPNLLFYGPPGTGKTTTIINLIKLYQERYNQSDSSLIMHLNASDERGIDTIRSNILSFVNSQTLFTKGLKFVILDEVDYMTKTAQIALRQLVNMNNNQECRFCLICNYISKLDSSLVSDFITIRFNDLPRDDVYRYLEHINKNEGLDFKREDLENIQKLFRSDMRSMINYIQNHSRGCSLVDGGSDNKYSFVNDAMLQEIYAKNLGAPIEEFIDYINQYRDIDNTHILKLYINYLVDICIGERNGKGEKEKEGEKEEFIEELKNIYFNVNNTITDANRNHSNYWRYIYYLVLANWD